MGIERRTRRLTRSMIHYSGIFHSTLLLLSCSSLLLCSSAVRDMICKNQVIHDGEVIISKREVFEFGFFTPDGAKHDKRYVGIWYHGSSQNSTTVVWVANRGKPFPNSKGSIAVKDHGSLIVLDELGNIFWNSNDSFSYLSSRAVTNTTTCAKLMDSGNLILTSRIGGVDEPVWQSFWDGSNTFLPGMDMWTQELVSWRNEHDPSPGSFAFQNDYSTSQSVIYTIMNRSTNIYWKSGSNTDFATTKIIPDGMHAILSNSTDSEWYDNNTRIVLHSSGQIRYYDGSSDLIWYAPSDNCSIYNLCGPYGICTKNSTNTAKTPCRCVSGYEPVSQRDWDSGNYSGGCTNNKLSQLPGSCKYDEFLPLRVITVVNPNTPSSLSQDMEDCKKECLSHCQCHAFSYQVSAEIRCQLWTKDNNPRHLQMKVGAGQVIYIRSTSSNIGDPKPMRLSLIIVISIAIAIVIVFSGIMRERVATERKAYRESNREISNFPFDGDAKCARDLEGPNKFGKKSIDVPFFNFEIIMAATNDFSNLNKLGQGGFGPVYKGMLMGGQEIAVKRLSRSSGQGLDEFKNEVLLIAKLQHKNLVKLLGYSVKGDEKILLYEYMPNKSLDFFIFDQSRCLLLNWKKRFHIILGIAQGVLYLHQESRLKIIHRDLKTSNILLDEEMNPKISDFGLARIFGGNQSAENTNRVVGTYGYMSPEYAIDGIFSAKSDVFSYGVMVLEIICGRKNAGFHSEHYLSLLGYAWELWKEDNVLDFIDKSLCESYDACEVSKCFNIGLLCVQENAGDRPTMLNVVSMLVGDTTVPIPKEPAFIGRKYYPSNTDSSSSRPIICSNNELTITEEQGQ